MPCFVMKPASRPGFKFRLVHCKTTVRRQGWNARPRCMVWWKIVLCTSAVVLGIPACAQLNCYIEKLREKRRIKEEEELAAAEKSAGEKEEEDSSSRSG